MLAGQIRSGLYGRPPEFRRLHTDDIMGFIWIFPTFLSDIMRQLNVV